MSSVSLFFDSQYSRRFTNLL